MSSIFAFSSFNNGVSVSSKSAHPCPISRNALFCRNFGFEIMPWGCLELTTLIERVAAFLSTKEKHRLLPQICQGFRAKIGSWQPREIIIGSKELSKEVQSIVQSLGLTLRVTADAFATSSLLFWGRDYKVTLHDGTQLFPYKIATYYHHPDRMKLFLLWMPTEIFSNLQCGQGTDISDEMRSALIVQAQDKRCKWKNSRVVIEGGNCRLTRNQNGDPVAIIGESSLILSMIALEEQGYFNERRDQLALMAQEKPSEASIIMARAINYRLQKCFVKPASSVREVVTLPSGKNEHDYWGIVAAPRGDEEVDIFSGNPTYEDNTQALARDIMAKLCVTKRVIAEEFRLPEKHIAFIPQLEWHVDMDVTPLSEGNVLVNEVSEIVRVLEAWTDPKDHRRDNTSPYKFVRELEKAWINDKTVVTSRLAMLENASSSRKIRDVYSNIAKRRAPIYAPIERERRRLIEAIGCRVIPVPGVYEGYGSALSLNFMNAIVPEQIRNFSYITNGAPRSCAYLQNAFQRALPRCQFEALRDTRILLTSWEGGIHCLHWMC